MTRWPLYAGWPPSQIQYLAEVIITDAILARFGLIDRSHLSEK